MVPRLDTWGTPQVEHAATELEVQGGNPYDLFPMLFGDGWPLRWAKRAGLEIHVGQFYKGVEGPTEWFNPTAANAVKILGGMLQDGEWWE